MCYFKLVNTEKNHSSLYGYGMEADKNINFRKGKCSQKYTKNVIFKTKIYNITYKLVIIMCRPSFYINVSTELLISLFVLSRPRRRLLIPINLKYFSALTKFYTPVSINITTFETNSSILCFEIVFSALDPHS